MRHVERERFREPPIFCEQCPNLALALVEGSPLCRKCLQEAVRGRGGKWVTENARPLDIIPPGISRTGRKRKERSDDTGPERVA